MKVCRKTDDVVYEMTMGMKNVKITDAFMALKPELICEQI